MLSCTFGFVSYEEFTYATHTHVSHSEQNNVTINDLPNVLILILTNQQSNDSLWWSPQQTTPQQTTPQQTTPQRTTPQQTTPQQTTPQQTTPQQTTPQQTTDVYVHA